MADLAEPPPPLFIPSTPKKSGTSMSDPYLLTWRPIDEFPGYSVSDEGNVRNDETGHLMTMLVNQSGVVNVGLTCHSIQHKRSVALLVATSFVPRHPLHQDLFDTPINLDGDRFNNRAENLMWRPRWFAIKYNQQFHDNHEGFKIPLEEVMTGEYFNNSFEASVRYGLLDREVVLATMKNTYVWPTYQQFRVLKL